MKDWAASFTTVLVPPPWLTALLLRFWTSGPRRRGADSGARPVGGAGHGAQLEGVAGGVGQTGDGVRSGGCPATRNVGPGGPGGPAVRALAELVFGDRRVRWAGPGQCDLGALRRGGQAGRLGRRLLCRSGRGFVRSRRLRSGRCRRRRGWCRSGFRRRRCRRFRGWLHVETIGNGPATARGVAGLDSYHPLAVVGHRDGGIRSRGPDSIVQVLARAVQPPLHLVIVGAGYVVPIHRNIEGPLGSRRRSAGGLGRCLSLAVILGAGRTFPCPQQAGKERRDQQQQRAVQEQFLRGPGWRVSWFYPSEVSVRGGG